MELQAEEYKLRFYSCFFLCPLTVSDVQIASSVLGQILEELLQLDPLFTALAQSRCTAIGTAILLACAWQPEAKCAQPVALRTVD